MHPSAPLAPHTQAALLQRYTKSLYPEAIVFIVMGELAMSTSVEDVLMSVRLLGHWEDQIIVLTDHKACFTALTNLDLTIIEVPSKPSLIEIKAMKAEMFQYLPSEVHRVLYMDVDILVTRHLGFFMQDLGHILFHRSTFLHPNSSLRSVNQGAPHPTRTLPPDTTNSTTHSTSNTPSSLLSNIIPSITIPIDMAAFLDAKGHYVGFCSGCEKWHTGVIFLTRGAGQTCLAAWAAVLRSGMFATDQESLDYVESHRNCTAMISIPSRHLLFAKDYIGMLFTSGQTFVHLTSANRLDSQDYFYREIMVPKIRNSLHPPLRPYAPAEQKQC
ncbi:hypothetical protein EON64_16860 [archaeon]|nr:MAG: hypothetical protein EON64_16860 [archaeon]